MLAEDTRQFNLHFGSLTTAPVTDFFWQTRELYVAKLWDGAVPQRERCATGAVVEGQVHAFEPFAARGAGVHKVVAQKFFGR